MPPPELLVRPSFDFLAKLEHQRLLSETTKQIEKAQALCWHIALADISQFHRKEFYY